MHIALLTTTYNRPAGLAALYASCAAAAAAAGVRLTRCLVDDHSATPYALAAGAEHALRLPAHQGRAGYWRVITCLWRLARSIKADYYLQLPDDMTLMSHGFERAIAHWEAIADPRKICLNLFVDTARKHGPCWTGMTPALHQFGSYAVYSTGWVDGCFLAPRKFFEVVQWHVRPVDRRRWRAQSSGVFAQVSHRLVEQGWHLYQTPHSLVTHGHEPSVMHPTYRPTHPLVS